MGTEEGQEEYKYVLQPGAIVGGFRVIRPLGHGGCGEVHEAENTGTERRVALKVLFPEHGRNATLLQRFRNEGIFMGRLCNATEMGDSHPFPEVYGAGEQLIEAGEETLKVHYLALEFFNGMVLEDILAKAPGSRLEPKRARNLLAQVLAALQAMHALGIIHRDLKPDNLMVVRKKDGTETVKVLDLGIARADGVESSTRTGSVVGTPYYMSPEQCDGKARVDHRTDLYAVGVILYEALAGFKPYERDSLPELFAMIACAPPKEMSEAADPVLKAIALKAIAKKPEDRFQSAEEFREALLAFERPIQHAPTLSDGSTAPVVSAVMPEVSAPAVVPTPRPAPAPTLGDGALRPVTMDTDKEHIVRSRRPAVAVVVTAGIVFAVVMAVVLGGHKAPGPTHVAMQPVTEVHPTPIVTTAAPAPIPDPVAVPTPVAAVPQPTAPAPEPPRIADNRRRGERRRHNAGPVPQLPIPVASGGCHRDPQTGQNVCD